MSTGDDGSRGGRRRGHLRGVRGDASTSTTGTTTDETTSDRTGGDVDDNSFSVPDLLATDALLDRLGRHEATAGDLSDAVARLLDSYALHADPETAGVRPVELPDLTGADLAPEHVPAPRVLLARRRTLQRLGRGTVAAAAVLTLLGGTAAAAATGVGPLGDRDGGVAASFASQLPGWFPDTVFEAFAGTPTERVQRELSQVRALAEAGDEESASARLKNLQRRLDGADVAIDATVVQKVDDALAALADGDLATVALDAPTGSPTASPTGSPTGTTLADVAVVATPTATTSWAPTRQTERPTANPTPSTAGTSTATPTPPRATSTPPAVPVVPVVPDVPRGGSGDAPAGPSAPSGTPQAPGSGAPSDTPTAPATDVPTPGPTDAPAPTDVPTRTPDVTPTDAVPSAEPTTDQPPGAAPTDPATPVEPAPGAGELPVATPTLPVVVEPSPSAGLVPVPGTGTPTGTPTGSDPAVPDASAETPAGS